MHTALLKHPHLTTRCKNWLEEIVWKQQNNALYYCTKVFKTQYGFGIYEGQCDKDGNTCGEGRWVCTEPTKVVRDVNYKGVTFEGCFKDDSPEGFGEFFID